MRSVPIYSNIYVLLQHLTKMNPNRIYPFSILYYIIFTLEGVWGWAYYTNAHCNSELEKASTTHRELLWRGKAASQPRLDRSTTGSCFLSLNRYVSCYFMRPLHCIIRTVYQQVSAFCNNVNRIIQNQIEKWWLERRYCKQSHCYFVSITATTTTNILFHGIIMMKTANL